MEHANITNIGIARDRDGQTGPGNEVDSAGRLDAYLVRADSHGRAAKMAS